VIPDASFGVLREGSSDIPAAVLSARPSVRQRVAFGDSALIEYGVYICVTDALSDWSEKYAVQR